MSYEDTQHKRNKLDFSSKNQIEWLNPILASSSCRLMLIFVHLSMPLSIRKASARHLDKNLVSFVSESKKP